MRLAIEAIAERGYVIQFAYDPGGKPDDRYHVQLVHFSGASCPWLACGPSFEDSLHRALDHVMTMVWEKSS